MSQRLVLAMLAIGLAAVPAWPQDYFQVFTGAVLGGPTWVRPEDDGPTLAASAVHYSAQSFSLYHASVCAIYSAQEFNGYIHLFRRPFNPLAPLTNLLGGDDNDSTSPMGTGSSRLPDPDDSAGEPTLAPLPSGDYVIVTSGNGPADEGSFATTIHCESAQPSHGAFAGSLTVVFHDRLSVAVDHVTNSASARGTPVRSGSPDTAFFWFYGLTNYELVVKVLDGCAVNDRYWVFIGGLTNQGYRVQVYDHLTDRSHDYTNTLGTRAPAVADTNAFDCTP
jgi:hypothetical protein